MRFPEKNTSILISTQQLQQRVAALGYAISNDFKDKPLTIVCLLKGSAIFTADLVRAIDIPLILDFMAISSYVGNDTGSNVMVKIVKDLDTEITGREVLIVEDIIDTGLTLNYLMKILRARSPNGIYLCTLLDRPARRIIEIPIKYCGFEIPDVYVVGYGLDDQQYYRNLPFIGVFNPLT